MHVDACVRDDQPEPSGRWRAVEGVQVVVEGELDQQLVARVSRGVAARTTVARQTVVPAGVLGGRGGRAPAPPKDTGGGALLLLFLPLWREGREGGGGGGGGGGGVVVGVWGVGGWVRVHVC